MSRQSKVYLEDVLQSIEKIEKYVKNFSIADFQKNGLVSDAVIRNLEIIGEAVKNLPPGLKKDFSEIEWKKISGLRDILIHSYFGIDLNIVWDVVKNKLPELRTAVLKILKTK